VSETPDIAAFIFGCWFGVQATVGMITITVIVLLVLAGKRKLLGSGT
jgi:hypothetical protein